MATYQNSYYNPNINNPNTTDPPAPVPPDSPSPSPPRHYRRKHHTHDKNNSNNNVQSSSSPSTSNNIGQGEYNRTNSRVGRHNHINHDHHPSNNHYQFNGSDEELGGTTPQGGLKGGRGIRGGKPDTIITHHNHYNNLNNHQQHYGFGVGGSPTYNNGNGNVNSLNNNFGQALYGSIPAEQYQYHHHHHHHMQRQTHPLSHHNGQQVNINQSNNNDNLNKNFNVYPSDIMMDGNSNINHDMYQQGDLKQRSQGMNNVTLRSRSKGSFISDGYGRGSFVSDGYGYSDTNNLDDSSYYSYETYETINYGKEDVDNWFEYLIYNDKQPIFTDLQLTVWAVLLGIFMGFFTQYWGVLIETCVEFTWKTVPEYLYEHGIFTDLDGWFPLPYYIIICPAVFGGILSYITAALTAPKVPGQNEWIQSLQTIGIMDHRMFPHVFLLSTAGMASGLSLGPEMPLVLTSGMVGSVIAIMCKQSIQRARVLNLTAASAAIGGFFGFPMAGALFVMELPHRMGLEYYEALSHATLGSIVAVIVNRMISGDEIKGMFKYPFLEETLPTKIFWCVIIYGIVGSLVGVIYAKGLLWLKHWVHEWFHAPHNHHHDDDSQGYRYSHINHGDAYQLENSFQEYLGQDVKKNENCCTWVQRGVKHFFGIEHEPTRAAVAGILVGILVGLNCMLLPHNLFWGEAQLQTLIDRGMTQLPVFGHGEEEPTSMLTAYGYCIIDPDDERAQIEGFSATCAGMIAATKIITVGLSLGTGICGGHFWAPLFVGCAASHFFTDIMGYLTDYIGFGKDIASYPCLAVLCIMGATHVVTFRAAMAIILVLTLSIKSFTTAEKMYNVNGDYSAIFPLLVIACFIPIHLTKRVKFYGKQLHRGDLQCIKDILFQPKLEDHQQVVVDGMDDMDGFSSNASGSIAYDDQSLNDRIEMREKEDTDTNTDLDPFNLAISATATSTSNNSSPQNKADNTKSSSSPPNNDDKSIHSLTFARPRFNSTDSYHSTRSIHSLNSNNRPRFNSTDSVHSMNSNRPRLNSTDSVGSITEENYQKPLLEQGFRTLVRRKSASSIGAVTGGEVDVGGPLPLRRMKSSSSRPNTPLGPRPDLPKSQSHRRTVSGTSMGSASAYDVFVDAVKNSGKQPEN